MEKLSKIVRYNSKLIPDIERHRLSENQVDEALDLLEKEIEKVLIDVDFMKQDAFKHLSVNLIELAPDEIKMEFEADMQHQATFDEDIALFMDSLDDAIRNVSVCGLRTADEYIPNCDVSLDILNPMENIKEGLLEMEQQSVTEYIITFIPNTELYNLYSGEYITEDKDEADEVFDRITQTDRLNQVEQYLEKTWVYSEDFGDYVEDYVEIYYTA